MTLVRTFPKMGGFPELQSYRCTACEEAVTVERRWCRQGGEAALGTDRPARAAAGGGLFSPACQGYVARGAGREIEVKARRANVLTPMRAVGSPSISRLPELLGKAGD
jgi:hypothetical protein